MADHGRLRPAYRMTAGPATRALAGAVLATTAILAPTAVLAPTAATAAPRDDFTAPVQQGYVAKEVAPDHTVSMKQAARDVRRAYGGRILSITPSNGGYRVRVDVDGRVKTVIVDDEGLRPDR